MLKVVGGGDQGGVKRLVLSGTNIRRNVYWLYDCFFFQFMTYGDALIFFFKFVSYDYIQFTLQFFTDLKERICLP